ncbi:MAG TPA: murein L,D-transpeptidase catalytic domain family protein [Gemmatimonadales bacterium]|nr:murein L,D-transpeptidase catalytic domain family protein [Gemmatimonadales bacterium]
MPRALRLLIPALAIAAAACARPRLQAAPSPADLPSIPAGMSTDAWVHAHAAFARAERDGRAAKPLLAVIDYSLPSSARRLWVVDLSTNEVVMNEYVAHGQRSGGTWTTDFSNRTGSNRSSLGTFVTLNTYRGVRGLSLRLMGLEPGINDKALPRGIVIHGTPNVSAARALAGRVGRTEGCPAVPQASARRLIRLLEGGAVVFAWYPDRHFLATSEYLDRSVVPFHLGETH